MATTPRSTFRLSDDDLAALDSLGPNRTETLRRLIHNATASGDVMPLPPRQIPGQESLLGVVGTVSTDRSDDVVKSGLDAASRHPSATPSQRITIVSGRCPVYRDGRHVVGLDGRCKACGTAV